MARLFFLLGAVAAVSGGCSANTATQERQATPPMQAEAVLAPVAAVAVPESPADRAIRHDLTLAIERDADLHDRQISFSVKQGDITVTGIVRTEEERRNINDLAMNIDAVKSVANALRVAE